MSLAAESAAPLSNWSGNYVYGARGVVRPASLDELKAILAREQSVRIVATRHTFTGVGDAEVLIDADALPGAHEIDVDASARTVRVGAGVSCAALADALDREGLAIANLASLPHISVAGAVATATHGSGNGIGNFATFVQRLEILTADGDEVAIDQDRIAIAAVHLGALGCVTAVTLAVVPSYEISQYVYEDLAWDMLLHHVDDIFALARSVSVFHRLGPAAESVWLKADSGAPVPPDVFGARPATGQRHPIPGGDPDACTPQLGVPGPWSDRLPHFRAGYTPSAGSEIQSEVFVDRTDAADAVRAVLELREALAPALLVGELRTVAADDRALSPQRGRDSLGIHFTWRRDPEAVAANVALIGRALAPLNPRPHWGKVMASRPDDLAAAYPGADAFRRLRAELDPRGVFVNDWMRDRVPFLCR